MNTQKKTVRDLEGVRGAHVFVRVDFNVPVENGTITDDTRIRASVPGIRLALDKGAAVMVTSHLGRPKEGQFSADDSLAPVAQRLSELLEKNVPLVRDWLGGVQVAPGEAVLLENCRFNKGEKADDEALAKKIAALCDVYVNDAFGSAHRAHASTEAVAHLLPAYAGLLLEAELANLGRLLGEVERPFVLISGGAKVEDKLGVLEHLGGRADTVLVGGKMAEQIREENPLSFPVVLPTDVVAAAVFEEDAEARVAPYGELPDGWLGLDIGPETRERFASEIAAARTLFWNGPMGVFEWSRFAEGTRAVAEAVAQNEEAFTVVGGADSIRALTEMGLVDRVDWASTGGGASLELLEGKELPGVAAIPS
jgi:phosphoglycerate kinase